MTHLHQWASTLLAGLLAFGCFGVAAQAQPETLRVEVIKPLQQAQELNKQNKNTEALARFAEVDALPAGNPLEVFTIERLRAVVHMAAGNSAAAAKAIEKALQTERGTVADRVALMENLVLIQYRAKQYADAALWAGRYLALGGQREQLRQVQGQALYLSGQFQPAVDILQPRLMAEIAAGRVPDEVDIRLLASAHQQTKNTAAYVSTLEILVRFYPKPEVWADLLFRVLQRKDFPAYLEIDLRRLMQQVGAANTFADALDHAQLAISAGYPAEARKVLESVKATAKPESPEEGSKLNAQLANATRLQQEDDKQLPQLEAQLAQARDGNPWVNTGLNLALAGQAARGATLIAQGIEKGGLRQADAARLRLAYAHVLAGQKDTARPVLQSLTGTTPEALLARLWLLHLPAKS
jgi:predicted Zn-dependent protease